MNAHPRFVRLELRSRQEAHIVGRERRDAALQGQFDDGFGMSLLACSTGTLNLEIEPITAKLLPTSEAPRRLIVAAAGKRLSDVALRAAR
jgi:hypothetical protein